MGSEYLFISSNAKAETAPRPVTVTAKTAPKAKLPVPPIIADKSKRAETPGCLITAFLDNTDLTNHSLLYYYMGKPIRDNYLDAMDVIWPSNTKSLTRAIREHEVFTKKKLSGVMGFQQVFMEETWEWQPYNRHFSDEARKNGCFPIHTLEINWFPGRDYNKFLLEQIIEELTPDKNGVRKGGPFYDYWKAYCRDMAADGLPIGLRLPQEPQLDSYATSGIANGADITDGFGDKKIPDGPERFKVFCELMIEVAREAGADNVSFIQCFDGQGESAFSGKDWNLPKHYMTLKADWLGWDGYQKGGETFTMAFKTALPYFERRTDLFTNRADQQRFLSMPIGIFEYSALPETSKPAFITEVLMSTQKYGLQLINIFNTIKMEDGVLADYRLNSPIYGGIDKMGNTIVLDDQTRYFSTLAAYSQAVSGAYFIGATNVPDVISIRGLDTRIVREAEDTGEEEAVQDFIGSAFTVSRKMLYFKNIGPVHARSGEYDEEMGIAFVSSYEAMTQKFGKLTSMAISKYSAKAKKGITGALNEDGVGKAIVALLDKIVIPLGEIQANDDMTIEITSEDGRTKRISYLGDIGALELKERLDLAKKNMLLGFLRLLALVPEDNEFYLRALDKLKILFFDWVEDQKTYNEQNTKISTSEISAEFKKVFNKKIMMEGLNETYPIPSPTSFICDKIIELTDETKPASMAYCKKMKIKEPERLGLRAAALAKKAEVILRHYLFIVEKDPEAFSQTQTDVIMNDARALFIEAGKTLEAKHKALTLWEKGKDAAWDAVSYTVNSSTGEAVNDAANYAVGIRVPHIKERDFDLKMIIRFGLSNIDAESGDPALVQKAIGEYHAMLADRRVPVDARNEYFFSRSRIKEAIARVFYKNKDKASISKAIGLCIEAGDPRKVEEMEITLSRHKK